MKFSSVLPLKGESQQWWPRRRKRGRGWRRWSRERGWAREANGSSRHRQNWRVNWHVNTVFDLPFSHEISGDHKKACGDPCLADQHHQPGIRKIWNNWEWKHLREIFLARSTTRTTVTRVMVATIIEQREGEVEAPASWKNLRLKKELWLDPMNCQILNHCTWRCRR